MARVTIYEALRDKLGREPTHKELCDDVKRILGESRVARPTGAHTKPREETWPE